MLKQLVFNSFPRSGNVYMSHLATKSFAIQISWIHIPQVYQIKDIYQVAIFRNPMEAIPSLLYKRYENNIDNSKNLASDLKVLSEEYLDYVNMAIRNIDNLYIVDFDKMKKNPIAEINSIGKFFDLDRTQQSEYFMDLNEKRWSDPFDGHFPRNKPQDRLDLEQRVLEQDLLNAAVLGYNCLMEML